MLLVVTKYGQCFTHGLDRQAVERLWAAIEDSEEVKGDAGGN